MIRRLNTLIKLSNKLTKFQKFILILILGVACTGCEPERKHFTGEVPHSAQNRNELPIEVKREDNQETIIVTFYPLPPAQGITQLPDVTPEPRTNELSAEEKKYIAQISRLESMDDKLNSVNQTLEKLGSTPLPKEPSKMDKIEFDTSRIERELIEITSNKSN